MSKKKIKNTKQQQKGGYKKFLADMQEVIKLFKVKPELKNIPHDERRMMYNIRIRISNPTPSNKLISSREVKRIAEKIKRYYRDKNIHNNNLIYSNYQLMLLSCFSKIIKRKVLLEINDENHPKAIECSRLSSVAFESFYSTYIVNSFKIITQLNSPDNKYYGLNIRFGSLVKDNPSFEIITKLYGIPPYKCVLNINGIKRLAYRLGKAVDNQPFEWIKLDKTCLGEYYTGTNDSLDIFIQSHAIKRLSQRLDLLNREGINYVLWENTCNIKKFETYKGYLLLPFYVYKVKVGYLLANIIDDKVLFRTFLFITHNFTPEGDKLKNISGIEKHDVSYWRIDRLSTFVSIDENKYPKVMDLFKNAGLEDLTTLKSKDFNVDKIQSTNLEGFMKYVKKGRQNLMMQQEDFTEILEEAF